MCQRWRRDTVDFVVMEKNQWGGDNACQDNTFCTENQNCNRLIVRKINYKTRNSYLTTTLKLYFRENFNRINLFCLKYHGIKISAGIE